jgi:hypothetical protein
VNEEALAHWGLSFQKKENKTLRLVIDWLLCSKLGSCRPGTVTTVGAKKTLVISWLYSTVSYVWSRCETGYQNFVEIHALTLRRYSEPGDFETPLTSCWRWRGHSLTTHNRAEHPFVSKAASAVVTVLTRYHRA